MTTYHLRGTDGTEVFTGTIQPPPGGGSQPNPGVPVPDGGSAYFGVPYTTSHTSSPDSLVISADVLYLFPLYLPFGATITALRMSGFIVGGANIKIAMVAAGDDIQPTGDLAHPEALFVIPDSDTTEITVPLGAPAALAAGKYLVTMQADAPGGISVATGYYPVQGYPDGAFTGASNVVWSGGSVARAYAPLAAPVPKWDTLVNADLGGNIFPAIYGWAPA